MSDEVHCWVLYNAGGAATQAQPNIEGKMAEKNHTTDAAIASLSTRLARLEAVVDALTHPALSACDAVPVSRKLCRKIISEVAAEYGVPASAIVGNSRAAAVIVPRHEAMRRARDAGISLSHIGRLMGGRDHTTVMHGIKRARERLADE